MTTPAPIIRIEDLHKSFGDLVVLDGVSFDIPKGRTTVLMGPSGTGKSVLLKIIVGLLKPDSGHIWIEGVDMANASERQARALRRKMGMMFQGGALFGDLTAGENVAFPLRYHTRLSYADRRARAQHMLELVELPDLYDRPTASLSGGQRKRVSLARAIVMEPDIVLFDEPNSGLDPVTSTTVDALIVRMQQTLGITFVVITHDIVQALNVGDWVGMLNEGDLVEYGTREQFAESQVPVVRAFLERIPDPTAIRER